MIKTLIASLLFVATTASASELKSCVIQVLKNSTNGQQAHFVFACNGETLATHATTPMNQMSVEDVSALKSSYMQALQSTVNSPSANCFEHESELFWIGICHN